MTEHRQSESSALEPPEQKPPASPRPIPNAPSAPVGAANEATPSASAGAGKLSADEQMALFEQELKEKDWGHQPC